jgi:hypothetical protein
MEKEKKNVNIIVRATRAERDAYKNVCEGRGGVSKVVRKHLDRLLANEKKKETT